MLPYRPFTLRQSRLATVNHKEIILQLSGNQNTNAEILDALLAVPQATGILIYLLCNLSGKREAIMGVFSPGWKRTGVEFFFLPFPRFSELSTWASQAAGGQ